MDPESTTERRGLLSGNTDLVELAAQLPENQRRSSWDVAWMAMTSTVLVFVGMVAAGRFETVYRELGVQLPARTEDVLQVWFHLVALGLQMMPIIWRFRAGPTSWATMVWFWCTILYMGFVILGLFMPLVGITSRMGEQAA